MVDPQQKGKQMEKTDFEAMSDDQLQTAEDWINEIQAQRAAADPHPIDAERKRVLQGVANFVKRFGESKTLMDMWK